MWTRGKKSSSLACVASVSARVPLERWDESKSRAIPWLERSQMCMQVYGIETNRSGSYFVSGEGTARASKKWLRFPCSRIVYELLFHEEPLRRIQVKCYNSKQVRLFGNNISINTNYVWGSDSIKQDSRMDTFLFIYKWCKFIQGSYSSIHSFIHSFPDLCTLLFTWRLFLHDDVHEGLSDVRRKAVEDMKKLREKSGTLKGYNCPSLAWCSFD